MVSYLKLGLVVFWDILEVSFWSVQSSFQFNISVLIKYSDMPEVK